MAVDCELSDRAVHVWAVTTRETGDLSRFEAVLSDDERQRADRFRFDHLRNSYVLSRGALRVLLARYLKAAPQSIVFRYGSKGKPALAGTAKVQFNASHSGHLALFAFAIEQELGIDIEAIRPMSDLEQIAARFFAREETEELISLPAEQRDRAFFLCWTRKEAYIKATGEGLTAPLDRFRVSLRPGEPARIIHLADDPAAARLWTLHDLGPAPGFAAALAYRDAPRSLEFFPAVSPKELLDLI